MNLRKMKLWELKKVAARLEHRVCCGYCDQLGGYHQGACHFLSKVRHGLEKRVTKIRPMLAHIRKKLDNSFEG